MNDKDALEALVDRRGLSALLFDLAAICGEKAAHLAANWQDTPSGKEWIKDASDIEKLAAKIRTT